MRIKPFFALLSFCSVATANAQYYYKDIIVIKQTCDELARLKEAKTRSVNVNSYETNGEPSEGFFCEKKINKDFTRIEITTEADVTPTSYFTSWFSTEGKLIRTSDSSEAIVVNTSYTYNGKQQLEKVTSISSTQNDDYSDDMTEHHVYTYTDKGLPAEMLLIKNIKDTTVIKFLADEAGNLGIEKNTTTGDSYYYYYNSKGWISDIVHNYAGKAAMVPDYVFEYNRNGQVVQMIASEDEARNHITWKYSYENGLRIGERCYSKANHLLGTIEYVYK